MNIVKQTLLASVFTTAAISGFISTSANAEVNPFSSTELVTLVDKHSEGKCGEGKCGEGKAKNAAKKGKCGEGKCGEAKAKHAAKKGKCGEGKCGEGKAKSKKCGG